MTDLTINLSTIEDARSAFTNSGWFDRLAIDDHNDLAKFLYRNASSPHVTSDELDSLFVRYATEVVGWDENDF